MTVEFRNIDKTALWDEVRTNIKKELSEQTYKTWIEKLSIFSIKDNIVSILVPDKFYGSWLREHYQDIIRSSFAIALGEKPEITYVEKEEEKKEDEKIQISRNTVNKGYVNSSISDIEFENKTPANKFLSTSKYTFDNFVVGSSCRFAHAAAVAVSEAPAKKYNPLFIYGPVGLGKTHLLQAISYEAKKSNPKINTLYISSEKFTTLLINAIQNKSMISFRKRFRNVDILLIDDIHFIAGKDATQEEFFHTFNDLYDTQKQIVLTSDRPPKDICGLEVRLVSRFEWGLITDIQPPEFETRVAILKKKMEKETVEVPDDVLYFIASKIKSNIRELEGALIRVVAYSSLIGHPIDLELTKNILKDSVNEEEKKITIDLIQKKCADYFNVKVSDMRTKKRNRSIAYPRQVAIYLVRSLTEHSLPEIGEYFGGRDHTTIIHSIAKIEKEISTTEKTKKIIRDIKDNISCE